MKSVEANKMGKFERRRASLRKGFKVSRSVGLSSELLLLFRSRIDRSNGQMCRFLVISFSL